VARRRQTPELPTREAVLQFIRESPSPVGKREIARAFQLSGPDRGVIATCLDELEERGSIARGRGRRYVAGNRIPSVAVLDVVGIDEDGEPVVALSDERQADNPPHVYLMADRQRGRAPGPGDRILARLNRQSAGVYSAQIVRVLERRPLKVFGVFRSEGAGGVLEPADRRQKTEFLIAENHAGDAEDGELVACETLPGRVFGRPLAKVVERIGRESDPRSVAPLVIARNDIPDAFSEDALTQAERCGSAPMDNRADLRDVPLVTIDDETARDYDDAVWAEPDGDPGNPGGWHMVVAIADVAWYVRPDDALDRTARERGNSVYLPDRVVPMLPEPLSNGWCSLNPGEDRPCLAVDMWIDAKGRKRRHRFRRAMIRSAARLTYSRVQRARDGGEAEGIPNGIVEPLYGAFQLLLAAREERGAIDLDMPERRAVLDRHGAIERIERRVRHDSHRLIEEFMILANICAAETLRDSGQPCMYRLHDDPAPDRVVALRSFLQTLGLRLAGGQAVRPRHFAQLVRRLAGRPHAAAVQDAILRTQAKAEYGPENIGHFGLALRDYAHFTSPIRRYSDLLVHRGLIRGLRLGPGGLDADTGSRFKEIGAHISMTERRAMTAEREALDRLVTLFLVDRVGASFEARVTGVERFGLFVELEETGANGLLPVSALGEARFDYDERRMALVSHSSDRVFRLGDRLRVALAEANPATGSLLFNLPGVAPREFTAPGGRGPHRRPGAAGRHGRSPGSFQKKRSR